MTTYNSFGEAKIFGVATADAPKSSNKKAYSVWYDMIFRCYSPRAAVTYPTYRECKVCDNWLLFSNFAAWHEDNYTEGFTLDKDILKKDNKEYSPENCCYVPKIVNSLTARTNMSVSSSLTGASFVKSKGLWQSGCRNPITKKNEYLGLFDSEILAHKVWAKRKSEIAIEVCASIPELGVKVMEAMKCRSFLEV